MSKDNYIPGNSFYFQGKYGESEEFLSLIKKIVSKYEGEELFENLSDSLTFIEKGCTRECDATPACEQRMFKLKDGGILAYHLLRISKRSDFEAIVELEDIKDKKMHKDIDKRLRDLETSCLTPR